VLARDQTLLREFERASADVEAILAQLRQRVTSQEGSRSSTTRPEPWRARSGAPRGHGDARQPATTALVWATEVRPKASLARSEMDAFIRHKQQLHDEARERVSRAQRERRG
jgi:hypothetical protein